MPKAGTTSLHRYLSEHPDTCMALDKEPHYFSVDLLQEGTDFHGYPKYTRYPTSEDYHTLFAERGSAYCSRRVISILFVFSGGCKKIYEYNPDAKIIIMLREPVAFLYSLHSQGLYSGNETESDFASALELESVRRQGQRLPSTVHFPSRLFYRDHWKITEQIKRFVDTFGTEQVRVIVFDDFKSDTETEVRGVMELSWTRYESYAQSRQSQCQYGDAFQEASKNHSRSESSDYLYQPRNFFPSRFGSRGKSCSKNKHGSLTTFTFECSIEKSIAPRGERHVQALQTYLHETGLSHADLMAMWDYPVDN